MQKNIAWMLLFAALLTGVYELLSYVQEESLLSVMGHTVLQKMSDSERARLEKEKKRRLQTGNTKRKSRICRLDLLLLGSGVKRSFPFLSTELFLLGMIGLITGAEILLFMMKADPLTVVWAPFLLAGAAAVCLQFLADRNYKRAEEQLLPFVNLIGNYSHSEDDLISIFGRMLPYLEEPYRSAAEDCCLYVKATGDAATAFHEMGMKIPHEQFARLMRNLEICCRHEANYGEIIDDSREMLQDYLRNKKERESVKKNARAELLILAGGCFLALWMMDGLTERSIVELLFSTLPGKIMLIYCGGVLAVCAKLFFSVK